MRILQLTIMLLFTLALPNVPYAGQSAENATKGTNAELECDYIAVPDTM
jgi:hypothetical protein